MSENNKWYAQYKCPKCGYETNVTNLCRSCQRRMYATGKECRWNATTLQDDIRDLQDPKEFEAARIWAGVCFGGDMLDGYEMPEWVMKVLKEVFHMDLSYWKE